ncbi:hypothetical protein I8748_08685 [Nostoc sp. CENA67]|uniref:Uncharacterized protein n=1 Tax=Amazonocrinis nigriterrae CENA67 TaxID=2794033 RepID=A0A8J7HRJ7_9NOST|nr:hypothetical protein [Amazonocrinis nigriterrae]MBH8562250.1 hypothetical protein [Amazonocrinis nigriterrae CENA67]
MHKSLLGMYFPAINPWLLRDNLPTTHSHRPTNRAYIPQSLSLHKTAPLG